MNRDEHDDRKAHIEDGMIDAVRDYKQELFNAIAATAGTATESEMADIENIVLQHHGKTTENDYPPNWDQIAHAIKERNDWTCERCKHDHDPAAGYCLTVHHLDGNKANCADWNLAALCQRCHLSVQGRVVMDQLFFLDVLPVSGWFKPHYEGYLASKAKAVQVAQNMIVGAALGNPDANETHIGTGMAGATDGDGYNGAGDGTPIERTEF